MDETVDANASLPYHEPGIVTILTLSSFLLLLNFVNFALDKIVYCGLLGQVFLGVAWGSPGAKWLDPFTERVVVQLGYLGLLLLVYEGGLSTSFKALKANLLLSVGVAITGISLPIALSFVLQRLSNATPLQCFAAGAALCSTSLGTTFTVLGTSGLLQSRIGVVLTSAAMMDDVVGLVMVQVISNLGQRSADISAATIVRPVMVSLAFAIISPVICFALARPITLWLNKIRSQPRGGFLNKLLKTPEAALVIHTLILISLVTAASYAGTSGLFAAYIAGASISWWDTSVPHFNHTAAPPAQRTQVESNATTQGKSEALHPSGVDIYEKYYLAPVNGILRPLFFASIGFSIPITQMFSGNIVWRGIIYTLLMIVGKVACGAWLLRFSLGLPLPSQLRNSLQKFPRPALKHFWGQSRDKKASKRQNQTPTQVRVEQNSMATTTTCIPSDAHAAAAGLNPRSLYPAAILGCAMTARGEIGFLISSIAESNKIFAKRSDTTSSSDIFLVVTWAIVLCTIIGPLAVGLMVNRVNRLQRGVEKEGRVVSADVLGAWGIKATSR